jgi:uncharacterized protein (DUF305 family)
MSLYPARARSHVLTLAAASAILVAAGCSSADRSADSAAASGAMTSSGSATMDSMPGMNTQAGSGAQSGSMQGMAGMTGDPDHDFLRMMSDHHKGLIQIAHMTKDRKDVGTAAVDATKLDTKQDTELDQMVTMLEKDFKDPYAPKVMPEHQQMAEELEAKSGKDYERAFYQDIIKHHQEAVKMVDDYLPRGKNAVLKGMAQTMKADQQKEIQEFQQKVARLGA